MIENVAPLVSVVTPVRNGSHYIDALIRSVRDQDCPDLEHIIIDDGSADNGATTDILAHYPHLHWWTRPNRGQYPTMNEGLRAAKGELICFISADDLMAKSAVRTAVEYLGKHSELDGAYGGYSYIDSQGIPIRPFRPLHHAPTKLYPYSLHISHSSLYLRRKTLLEKGLFFDETLHYVGDYDWIVRLLRAPLRIGRISRDLSVIRVHEHQTTNVSFFAMRDEIIKTQKRLGISRYWASVFRKILFTAKIISVARESGPGKALKALADRVNLDIS
jgi:glycosyltransferase involved in cell wall biosynthesis